MTEQTTENRFTLHTGDNLHALGGKRACPFCSAFETLAGIPADSVDVVLTDPPYCSGGVSEAQRKSAKGMGVETVSETHKDWFRADNMGTAGIVWLMRTLAVELFRVLKPTGHFFTFTDWRMVSNLVPALESVGFSHRNIIVWDKGHPGMGFGFRPQHEFILQFGAPAMAYNTYNVTNVLKSRRVPPARKLHPTEKPVDLLAELLRKTCPPGGVVLDPFMGSGSTGVAALELGFRFIGIDVDEGHAATAADRLHAAKVVGLRQHLDLVAEEPEQPRLFEEPGPGGEEAEKCPST